MQLGIRSPHFSGVTKVVQYHNTGKAVPTPEIDDLSREMVNFALGQEAADDVHIQRWQNELLPSALGRNLLQYLKQQNPNTDLYCLGGLGTLGGEQYILTDDAEGNHYSQKQKLMQEITEASEAIIQKDTELGARLFGETEENKLDPTDDQQFQELLNRIKTIKQHPEMIPLTGKHQKLWQTLNEMVKNDTSKTMSVDYEFKPAQQDFKILDYYQAGAIDYEPLQKALPIIRVEAKKQPWWQKLLESVRSFL